MKIHFACLLVPFIAFGADYEKASLVFSDAFERMELGDAWVSHPHSFSIQDGVMVASQQPDADHGAVTRTQLNFENIWIRVDVKFSGAERFNFVINDKQDKSVHAGHICRLSINPGMLSMQDDKSGVMNLAIRKQREDPRHRDRIEALLASKKSTADISMKRGQWYQLDVVIFGERMEAWIDGKWVASLKSEGIAHPSKTQFGFTVTGQSMHYDNVKAWSLKPKP